MTLEKKPDRRQGGAPTILDVARHAGVSRMTVSRVINGESSVKPDTRRTVDAAIRALNYAPNPAARTLAGGAVLRIGLISRIPSAAYLGEYLIGALDRCGQINAQLIVQRHKRGVDDGHAADMLIEARLDGVILPPPLADAHHLTDRLSEAGIVMVATGAVRSAPSLASIGIDDRGAAREMTRHLTKLGHRRIGFITGLPNHASSGLRLAGYREALTEAGLEVDEALIAHGTYSYQSGLEAAEHLLALDPAPTAIFASNDDMAAAAIAAAHRQRLDVPTDLSVCGFDDTPVATTIWPELTTIRQPVAAMAEGAVTMLADMIGRQRAGQPVEIPHRLLDYEFIRRYSDGPARPE
ncbi:MAG TPA: LacI family DNA-binding transcriptional regulator [Allosphingosinicella sp.]|nr:LacI family DNA-binding transcriptional regulator [Allosphingosinicella sp.]